MSRLRLLEEAEEKATAKEFVMPLKNTAERITYNWLLKSFSRLHTEYFLLVFQTSVFVFPKAHVLQYIGQVVAHVLLPPFAVHTILADPP